MNYMLLSMVLVLLSFLLLLSLLFLLLSLLFFLHHLKDTLLHQLQIPFATSFVAILFDTLFVQILILYFYENSTNSTHNVHTVLIVLTKYLHYFSFHRTMFWQPTTLCEPTNALFQLLLLSST